MNKKYLSLEHSIRKAVFEQNYKKKNVNEDFEYEMARNELRTAINAAKRLMAHLEGEGEIEAWVQSKITKASDYLDTVADYMDSGDKAKLKEHTEELFEAIGVTGSSKYKGGQFDSMRSNVVPVIGPGHERGSEGVSNQRKAAKEKSSETIKGNKVAEETEAAGTKYRMSLAASIVGRPEQGKEKLAKQAQIKTKIIDEQKMLAIKVKEVIRKKSKDEGESKSGETEVDFKANLKKSIDEDVMPSDQQITSNLAATQRRGSALRQQQQANAARNRDMEAKFQRGEITKDELEKHYKGPDSQVAALAPAVRVAKQADQTTPEKAIAMARGAENVANYSPSAIHQVAQAGLKAAGGDYTGALSNAGIAAIKPAAAVAKWLTGSKIAAGGAGATAAIAPNVVAGAMASEKPSGAPTPPPQPAQKPEPEKPSGAPPAPPTNPNPPPKPPQPAKVASGEGKVGQELAKYGIGKSGAGGRLSQQTLDDYGVKAKLGSAQANMELLAKAKERAAATAAPKPEPEKPAAPTPAPEPQKAPETPAPEEKESGGKKKKVNESALIQAFLTLYKNK